MNLIFHGAAHEVGRSCIEFNTNKTKILLDSGVKVTPEGLEYPVNMNNFKNVNAILLSHAHLDHSGALPYFTTLGLNSPIYCTEMTKKISNLLVKDSHKVEILQNYVPKYTQADIRKAINLMKVIQINKQYSVNDILFTFLPAGHIPGSCSILLETNHKKILYTGDFNAMDIHTMSPAQNVVKNVDYLITETTYGNREHPLRKNVENDFVNKIKEIINNGGRVVVAAFAVGRVQELLMILANAKIKKPVFIDGMGKKINKIILESAKNFNDIKDYKAFKKAVNKVKIIKNKFDRQYAAKQKGIILTTSGMLTGGPIIGYIKEIQNNPKNAILMTGYQVEGTNGRTLMETNKLELDGIEVEPKAQHYMFDFSAHAGLVELKEFVKKVNPKHVILQHGDDDAILFFKNWLVENNYNVIVPDLNEKIDLN